MYWRGSNDIKDLLLRVLHGHAADFAQKTVIDMPAGNGVTSRQLLEWGAQVQALDLFPEFFKVPGVECRKVDLTESLPLPTACADWIIFQEGIEHLPDQFRILRECARVLRPDGKMILSTPNTSNLRSKLAHLLLEAETLRVLPPNEVDSVWASSESDVPDAQPRIYFGHLFSIGIQRLRTLAMVAGLEIVRIHPARVNWSSFWLWCVLGLWIRMKSSEVYRRSLRKKNFSTPPEAYRESLALMRDLNVLCSGHLIVEFRKCTEASRSNAIHEARALREFVT